MEAFFWIVAILGVVFIPCYCAYLFRRAKQRRFNREWGLPHEDQTNDVENAEILGRTGFIDDLTDGQNISG